MGLRHVSLLTFDDSATTERVEAAVAALRALAASIPAIRHYQVGLDAGLADGNASLVVIADVDDAEGWRAYTDHPEHQRVLRDHLRPMLASRVAAQFTT